MDLHITFRHSDTSPALKRHVEEKLIKLSKYFIKAVQAHVILNVEHGRHIAEITLSENQHVLTSRVASHDMYHSLDEAIHKIERQLKKIKEKIKSHHTLKRVAS